MAGTGDMAAAGPGAIGQAARRIGQTARRIGAFARERGEAGAARRLAAAAFAARVLNAGLGFATQILLARWMGERDYGIYAYLWVWLLVAGGVGSLGLPVAALKFVPDYRARGDEPGLRGFLRWSRGPAILPSALLSLAAAFAILAFVRDGDALLYAPAALVALAILPLYVLTDVQTGIARACGFADLGLAADYVLRPVLLLAFAGAVVLAGDGATAATIMAATLGSMAVTALVQGTLLHGRLRRIVPAGPVRTDLARWASVSWPLLTVTAFTLLLGTTDVIVLKLFTGPEEIGIYFAATKIVAIASFVSYGVANTSAHRFAAHAATGDRAAMARLAAETVRWTFWPTLAVALALIVLADPLLRLFGPQFAGGTPIVAVLALGLVAAASVGPADRALAMADHGRITAWIYAASFAVNAALALLLIPPFGLTGAAFSTALAMAAKAAMLHVAARRRLDLDMFVTARPPAGDTRSRDADALTAEILTASAAEAIAGPWRELTREALEPNVFFEPATALAGMRHLPEERRARLLVAWRGAGDARRLVGLMPILPGRGRHLNPLPIRRAAAFYGTLSTPLVAPDRPEETLSAMLDALARAGIRGVLMPHLAIDGPVAAALERVQLARGLGAAVFDSHARAMLSSPLAGADYVRATLEPRRRKEADRQRRRLAEDGELAFTLTGAADRVPDALETFLSLEAAGWKGRLGTDLLHAPGAASFIRDLAREMSAEGTFRVATLTQGGRAVAAGLVLVAGRRAFYIKTAFDEAYAKSSPGLLLTLDLTAHLLDDSAIDDADSIAVADHPMIDRVWTHRFSVASVLLSTRAGGGPVFRAATLIERSRERVRLRVRRMRADLIAKLKRSREPAGKDAATKAHEAPAR